MNSLTVDDVKQIEPEIAHSLNYVLQKTSNETNFKKTEISLYICVKIFSLTAQNF